MKKNVVMALLAACLLASCSNYTKLYKSNNYDYRYEAAKEYFALGDYNKAAALLADMITILKGSDRGEESLYMLAMSYYNQRDLTGAAQTFQQYYAAYPRGRYVERARFYAGKSLFETSPEYKLDQSGTYTAISELQTFLEFFPTSPFVSAAEQMIFSMQDKLVQKELGAAQLYYNLGTYLGNNYQSCVITAQNTLKDYPYTAYREELSLLVVKAKYEMAVNSVQARRAERYRDTIDECYAFKNEFPESKEMDEVDDIMQRSEKTLATLPDTEDEEEDGENRTI